MISLISRRWYPDDCNYDKVWQAPGDDFAEVLDNHERCAETRARVDSRVLSALTAIVVVVAIAVILMTRAEPGPAALAVLLLGGAAAAASLAFYPRLARTSARADGVMIKNLYAQHVLKNKGHPTRTMYEFGQQHDFHQFQKMLAYTKVVSSLTGMVMFSLAMYTALRKTTVAKKVDEVL